MTRVTDFERDLTNVIIPGLLATNKNRPFLFFRKDITYRGFILD